MLIIVAAIVIAGVLVAPVVLRGSGGSSSHCETRVRFRQHTYVRHSGAGGTQGAAIGVGVLTGCGRPPANVNVRSLVGIAPARAIAIEGDSASFVIIPSG